MISASTIRLRLAIASGVLLLAFQNCGSDFVVRGGGSFSSSSVCEASLEADFSSSYHSLLKTKCASCHTGAGPGNGAFANSNSSVAFSAFLLATSAKIDTYAQNTSHASGYTGSQNASAIAIASQSWAAAAASCKNGPSSVPTRGVVLNSKSIPAQGADVSWNLDSDVKVSTVATGGASLIVNVVRSTSANGTTVLYLSNLRLKGGTKSVSASGAMPMLDGQVQSLGSTYSRVSGTAAAGQTTVLSAATLILESPISANSLGLAFSIDTLALTN